MLRQTLVVLCLLAGVGLVIASLAWTHIFPPQWYWSAEQAQEYVEASHALKAAAMREGRRADDPPDPQLARAQSRFDKVSSDLDRAIAARSYTGVVLGAGGITLAVAAVWVHRTGRGPY